MHRAIRHLHADRPPSGPAPSPPTHTEHPLATMHPPAWSRRPGGILPDEAPAGRHCVSPGGRIASTNSENNAPLCLTWTPAEQAVPRRSGAAVTMSYQAHGHLAGRYRRGEPLLGQQPRVGPHAIHRRGRDLVEVGVRAVRPRCVIAAASVCDTAVVSAENPDSLMVTPQSRRGAARSATGAVTTRAVLAQAGTDLQRAGGRLCWRRGWRW